MGTGGRRIAGGLVRRLALAGAASAVCIGALASPASAAVTINLNHPGFAEDTAFSGEVATFADDADEELVVRRNRLPGRHQLG